MKLKNFLLLAVSNLVFQWAAAQIAFEKLSWEEAKAKAKKENKFIFLDVYATWCGPCKMMEEKVYNLKNVGDAYNQKFISVKVQMDKTAKDNDAVKAWYNDALFIQQQYGVAGFPTFLFITPGGELLHKDMGFKSDADFINLAKTAFIAKPYTARLNEYEAGNMNSPAELQQLALEVHKDGSKAMTDRIVASYLQRESDEELFQNKNIPFLKTFRENEVIKSKVLNYLNEKLAKVNDGAYTKDQLEFIAAFSGLLTSGSKIFKAFCKSPEKINATLGSKGYAERVVKFIINREEIDAVLWQDRQAITKTPDWKKIENSIQVKYGQEYVDRLVPDARINFYKRVEDWRTYAKLFDAKLKKHPPTREGSGYYPSMIQSDDWALNGEAWEVFLKCTDKKVLERAVAWANIALELEKPKLNEQCIDTKANLLYKLGKTKEAIELEKSAVDAIAKRNVESGKDKYAYADIYLKTVQKMEKGLPTWTNEN